MKISLITISKNSQDFIEETINSVLEQIYCEIEYIIVDGASTDSTLNIINNYKKKISKIISEPDNGIYDAMNKGISMTTGDIVSFINSDDFYINNRVLKNVVKEFNNSAIDAVYSNIYYINRNNPNIIVRQWKSKQYKKRDFYWGWMPPHPTLFIKKHIYDKYGLFNTNFKISSDYELILRFFLKYNIKAKYLDLYTIKMRVGGVSSKNLKNRFIANKEDRKAWKTNDLNPYFFTTNLKPIRKIYQYF